MQDEARLYSKLDLWKNQLIDTSKRNRLLFFRPSRSGSLQLVMPGAETLFQRLVRDEKPLTVFMPAPVTAEGPILDLGLEEMGPESPTGLPQLVLGPGEVLADLEPQRLRRVLYSLRLRGRTAVAEQGVNILFVAFGILDWIDPGRDERRASPLILVPVEVRRESALLPYRVCPIDEDVVVNPTLEFLLGRDCNLTLPRLPEDLDEASFDAYADALGAALGDHPDWSVRREVHLGTFSFQKLVIYEDLARNSARLLGHPVVRALAGDPSAFPSLPPLPTAGELDQVLQPEATFQVLDADSSQQEAIEAVKRGVSLVLQGPPGTGKSQTIANTIAESLAAGKRVLFVSEKMAALQVVFSRLKERKLADFCLEVHSAKASKLEILRELGRVLRLDAQPEPTEAIRSLARLRDLRSQLNQYVERLHAPRGAMRWSAYHVHGQLAALHSVPDLMFSFAGATRLGPEEIAALDNLLMRMEGVRSVIAGCETHPWRGCLIPQFSFEVQSEIHNRFGRAVEELSAAEVATAALATACQLPAPRSLHEIDRLLDVADLVRTTPRPPAQWFERNDLPALISEAQGLRLRYQSYRETLAKFRTRYRPELLDLRLPPLLELTTSANEELLSGFAKEGEPGRAALWRHAHLLKPVIDELPVALERVEAVCQRLSTLCGVPQPTNLQGAERLLTLTALASDDPRPLRAWFQRSHLRALRDLLGRAAEEYSALQRERPQLLANFDPGILSLDLDALVARFSADYGSLLRLLRPSYWADLRRLRSLQNVPGKLTVPAALEALRLARSVRERERWVREHEPRLEVELGTWFDAAATSWERVLGALEHVGGILDWCGQSAPPERLIDLLAASGEEIARLREQHEQARSAVSRIQGLLHALGGCLSWPHPSLGDSTPQNLHWQSLREWLVPLRSAALAFWTAQDTVIGHAVGEAPTWETATSDLRGGCSLQEEEAALEPMEQRLREQYGPGFTGVTTAWQLLIQSLAWTGAVRDLFQQIPIPEGFVRLVAHDGGDLTAAVEGIGPCRTAREEVRRSVEYVTSLFTPVIFQVGGGVAAWEFDTLRGWLTERIRRSAALDEWIDFRRVREACGPAGLEPFLTRLINGCPDTGALRDLFYRCFYRLWLDEVHAEDAVLQEFRGREHDRRIEQFQELDRQQWARLGPDRVRHAVTGRRTPIPPTNAPNSEPGILLRELEKRRRHKPLRQLFAEIPGLLQELKPCLMMSPMTVSQLLDPERYQFDLVIFDEASQICAEDAVGAIYRGEQVVVAGDRHQLPPTRFFSSGLSDAYDSDDPEAEEEVFESILDQCRTMLPVKALKWHYRSRHESLIAFSNAHIYSQDPLESLKTFPSAVEEGAGLGIEWIHVPDGVYDRRRTRRNEIEARRVAELVIEHARRDPHRSLGVVAFSEAQQMAILTELERLRWHHPELESWFEEKAESPAPEKLRSEPFFVKNLENVQGDERDVIILNVGYGRDSAGALYLNFGPLNRVGGERRLNVAITRAKHQLKLVTSLKAQDLNLTQTQSRGLHLLRAYLEYAERGPGVLPRHLLPGPDFDEAPLEEEIERRLVALGHSVERRVGIGGYQVDLAIRDQEAPGTFRLGLECDGRDYLKADTARDRDRLARVVLEGRGEDPGLGWRLHRVWSADWVKDPDREVERILSALAEPPRERRPPVPLPDSSPEAVIGEHTAPDDGAPQAPDMNAAAVPVASSDDGCGPFLYERISLVERGELADFRVARINLLTEVLHQVVLVEGPIRLIDATRRVASAWGIRKPGSQIQASVDLAAQYGCQRGLFRKQGEFLWPSELEVPPVRTHEGTGYDRKIEEICPEELAEAVLLVLRRAFSLPEADLLVATARILGFGRTGTDVRRRLQEAVEDLIADGRVTLKGGNLALA